MDNKNLDLFKLVIWIAIQAGIPPEKLAVIDELKVKHFVDRMVKYLDQYNAKRGLKVVENNRKEDHGSTKR